MGVSIGMGEVPAGGPKAWGRPPFLREYASNLLNKGRVFGLLKADANPAQICPGGHDNRKAEGLL